MLGAATKPCHTVFGKQIVHHFVLTVKFGGQITADGEHKTNNINQEASKWIDVTFFLKKNSMNFEIRKNLNENIQNVLRGICKHPGLERMDRNGIGLIHLKT